VATTAPEAAVDWKQAVKPSPLAAKFADELALLELVQRRAAELEAALQAALPALERLEAADYPGSSLAYSVVDDQTGAGAAGPFYLCEILSGLLEARGDIGAYEFWSARIREGRSESETLAWMATDRGDGRAPIEAYLDFVKRMEIFES